MINVLPEEGRAAARAVYSLRLLSLGFFLAGGLAFFALIALLPAYFSAREESEAARERLSLAEASLRKETESSIGKDITLAGKAVPLLSSRLAAPRPTPLLEGVFAARDASIRLSRLEFTGGGNQTVRVSGTAGTRDALISFNRKLSSLPGAPSVDLPVSNLAKSENAAFTLTIQFKKP